MTRFDLVLDPACGRNIASTTRDPPGTVRSHTEELGPSPAYLLLWPCSVIESEPVQEMYIHPLSKQEQGLIHNDNTAQSSVQEVRLALNELTFFFRFLKTVLKISALITESV